MKFQLHFRSKGSLVRILIIVWYLFIMILPRGNNIFLAIIYGMSITLFALVCTNRINGGKVAYRSQMLILFLICFLLGLIDICSFGIVSGINTFFRNATMYLGVPLFCYVDFSFDVDQKKKIEKTVIVLWMTIGILQLYLYINNNSLEYARSLASETQTYFSFVRDAYGFCIGSILISCAVLEKFIKSHKISYIIVIIICSLIVYFTKSTILLLTYCSTVFYIIINSLIINGRKHVILKRVILLLIISAVIVFRSDIGLLLLRVSVCIAGIVGQRIREMGQMLVYKSVSNDIGGRFDLYTLSIKSFLNHPLLGAYVFLSTDIYGAFGNHSEWLDMLGKYGLLMGGTILFWIWRNVIKEIKNSDEMFNSHVIIILLAGLLNPISYFSSMFVLFFVIPGINKNWY